MYVVFIWRTTNLTRRIQDDLQWHTIYDEVWLLLTELVGSLANSLTRWLTRWQTDWSNYLNVLIKDSVGTNWMLFGEGTLLVSLLPALHPLHVHVHVYTCSCTCTDLLFARLTSKGMNLCVISYHVFTVIHIQPKTVCNKDMLISFVGINIFGLK